MTEHTLQTQNLSVGYDETTIIEDLNLEIPAHEVSVIIGANGCGKCIFWKTLRTYGSDGLFCRKSCSC